MAVGGRLIIRERSIERQPRLLHPPKRSRPASQSRLFGAMNGLLCAAMLFVWVVVVLVLRSRRYALLQSICNSALSESDATRQRTLVWFAHYLLTSLELNFEVKTAMSFRGLLATCVPIVYWFIFLF